MYKRYNKTKSSGCARLSVFFDSGHHHTNYLRSGHASVSLLIMSVWIKKALAFLQGLLRMVPRPGIEPGTRGFSIRCSTN